MFPALSSRFPRYADHKPRVPVFCVTPDHPGSIIRFYDTSPFSPSGRYLAVTQMRVEHRPPCPGETAQIIVVDLENGETNVVSETRGWYIQLGAQLQWGADDHSLFFNDVDLKTWKPFGWKVDPLAGKKTRLDGTVYMISPDGQWAASPCLLRTAITQAGYGVVVPRWKIPTNVGASDSDGIYVTSTYTGQSGLLLSMAQIVSAAPDAFPEAQHKDGDFYGFHVKWNPQGTRLMFVLRWLPRSWIPTWLRHSSREDGRKYVVTANADGSNVRVAIPDSLWCRGGTHPNWCPDGDRVIMNLSIESRARRFIRTKYDGSNLEVLAATRRGSGHPTLHPNGTHILTDLSVKECQRNGVDCAGGVTPMRWVDVRNSTEVELFRIGIRPTFGRSAGLLRVDPHPAWDSSYTRIAFNACPDGRRKVFVADLRELLAREQASPQAA